MCCVADGHGSFGPSEQQQQRVALSTPSHSRIHQMIARQYMYRDLYGTLPMYLHMYCKIFLITVLYIYVVACRMNQRKPRSEKAKQKNCSIYSPNVSKLFANMLSHTVSVRIYSVHHQNILLRKGTVAEKAKRGQTVFPQPLHCQRKNIQRMYIQLSNSRLPAGRFLMWQPLCVSVIHISGTS